jgi:hypothetical protein
MIQSIGATVCGQDETRQKSSGARQMQRSIRQCMDNCISHATQLVFSKLEQEAVASTNTNIDAVDDCANACGEGMDVNDTDADAVDVDAADDADADRNAMEDIEKASVKTCHTTEQNCYLRALQ